MSYTDEGRVVEHPDQPTSLKKLTAARQKIQSYDLAEFVGTQLDLAFFPFADRKAADNSARGLTAESNELAWRQFIEERLYDTRRVTLEHFHLFEWFPLSPGRFHEKRASIYREEADRYFVEEPDAQSYYDPNGKLSMLRGGIGAVRLRPRHIGEEEYYFMTASSSAVCHEGFPVLVPRRFYGPLKERILDEGAVPVTISGEMRYIDGEVLPGPLIEGREREMPLLYLHVDDLEDLRVPRPGVSRYYVSVAACFAQADGPTDGSRETAQATYATFDPADRASLDSACNWMEQFYVGSRYGGTIVTDFDEVKPHFPEAVFGIAPILNGALDLKKAESFLARRRGNFAFSDTGNERASYSDFYRRKVYNYVTVYGDQINVGSISNSTGVAIGRDAQASVSSRLKRALSLFGFRR